MSETTQTEQSAAPQQQGSHHWILTLELPGRATSSNFGTLTPLPGWTRMDAFTAIKEHVAQQNPEMAGANTVFFSLEPNQL